MKKNSTTAPIKKSGTKSKVKRSAKNIETTKNSKDTKPNKVNATKPKPGDSNKPKEFLKSLPEYKVTADNVLILINQLNSLVSEYLNDNSPTKKKILRLLYELISGNAYYILRKKRELRKKRNGKYINLKTFYKELIHPYEPPKRNSEKKIIAPEPDSTITKRHRSTLNNYINSVFIEIELGLEHGKYSTDALVELRKGTDESMRLAIWENIKGYIRSNIKVTKPIVKREKNKYLFEIEKDTYSKKMEIDRKVSIDLLFEEHFEYEDQLEDFINERKNKKSAKKQVAPNPFTAKGVLDEIKNFTSKQKAIFHKLFFPKGKVHKLVNSINRNMMTNEFIELRKALEYEMESNNDKSRKC